MGVGPAPIAQDAIPHDEMGRLASPCNSVCTMHDDSGWCRGCLRTLAEIAGWAAMDEADKRAVWLSLPARRVDWRAWRNGRKPSNNPIA